MKSTRTIAQAFSRAHKTYEQSAYAQNESAIALAHILSPYIEPNSKILDIGCGTGLMSQVLQQHQIIGIDQAFGLLTHTPDRVIQTDMHHMPFKQGTFDHACSNLALQWSHNPTYAFKEAARVLKTQGVLGFSVPLQGSLYEISHCWKASGHKDPLNPLYDQHTWQAWASKAGFSVLSYQAKNIVTYYPSAKEAFLSLKKTGANHQTRAQNHEKKPGLGGKKAMLNRINAYETLACEQGYPLTFEIGLFIAQAT